MIRRTILALALSASLAPAFAQAPPPVPALPDAERRTSFTLAASTCACSVGFALYGDSTDYQSWVEVFVNGIRKDFNDPSFGWTITSPSGSLGSIARPVTNAVLTFNAPQTGTIQVVGARRPRRVSTFAENQGVAARDLNQVINDMESQLRESWDKTNDVTGRAIMAAPGETLALLPSAANRAGKFLCWDSTGLSPSSCTPFTGPANIGGPVPSTDRSIPTWNGTAGNLLRDNPIVGISSAGALTMNSGSGATSVAYMPQNFVNSTLVLGNGGTHLVHNEATFTATITGNTTLHVSAIISGTVPVERLSTATLSGAGVTGGTQIRAQLSGPAGGVGDYTITSSTNVASPTTMTAISLQGYYNTTAGLTNFLNATTASYNSFFGFETGEFCTTCFANSGFGEANQIYNIDGGGNSSFGWKALLGTQNIGLGDYNTAGGYSSGWGAGQVAPTSRNTSYGAFSLSAAALAGNDSTAFGYNAGGTALNGPNALFGANAGPSLTAGTYNLFAGPLSTGAGIATGNYNTILGNCPALAAGTSNRVQLCDGAGNVAFDSTIAIAGFANPTGLIGLAAVNGVATTAVRSDATHALDQSIAPTWMGKHVFSGTITNGGSQSASAWTTNGLMYSGTGGTHTDTTSAGTVAAAYDNLFGQGTIAATNVTTFTNYFTNFIRDPTTGTNVTITNKWGLGAESSKFGTTGTWAFQNGGNAIGTTVAVHALTAGPNGLTNPVIDVDASIASQATGIRIVGAATGVAPEIVATDSGSNTPLKVNAKGSGQVQIAGTSTGGVSLGGHVTAEGVTSTGATGTGNLVFSAAPTITGHPTIEGVTSTGATGTGALAFGTAPTLDNATLATRLNKGVYVVCMSAVTGMTVTGTLVDTTLATCTIPANAMGANGALRITGQWTKTGTAGTVEPRIKFGGTSFTDNGAAGATVLSGRQQTEIHNRNATNSQIGTSILQANWGVQVTSTSITTALDTTASQNITLTCQLGNTGDTCELSSYLVELIEP